MRSLAGANQISHSSPGWRDLEGSLRTPAGIRAVKAGVEKKPSSWAAAILVCDAGPIANISFRLT